MTGTLPEMASLELSVLTGLAVRARAADAAGCAGRSAGRPAPPCAVQARRMHCGHALTPPDTTQ